MSAIEGVVAYQRWSLRGVPLYCACVNLALTPYLTSSVSECLTSPGPTTRREFSYDLLRDIDCYSTGTD